MDHLAIMRKSWGLTEKIISGEKKIESRWYRNKCVPWDRIKTGETIYFKNTGEPVSSKAEVESILQFSGLTPERVKSILVEYGKDDGIDKERIPEYFERFQNKKYCLLVFLKNPQKVIPFEIDKTGFGAMAAWIMVDDIDKIKVNHSVESKERLLSG